MVSNLGRVKSLGWRVPMKGGVFAVRKGKILKPMVDVDGYLKVMLCKPNSRRVWKIHRLVAIAFIPNPSGLPVINHKNEDKTDNRVENLEWCTVTYNQNYGGRQLRCRDTRMKNKIGFKSVIQYGLDGGFISSYESTASAARAVGCRQGAISNCCIGRAKSAGGFHWEYASNEKTK